jgi:integrase-like protein
MGWLESPALSRARLRRETFHMLRHSCASAMISEGAPTTEIPHRLGHAGPAITFKFYSHFFKDTEGQSADDIAHLIFNGDGHLGETRKKWALSWHSNRYSVCADRRKSLINKAWRRKGPGGPTGLQNACATFSCVMLGHVAREIAIFSRFEVTVDDAVEVGSGHSVGTQRQSASTPIQAVVESFRQLETRIAFLA